MKVTIWVLILNRRQYGHFFSSSCYLLIKKKERRSRIFFLLSFFTHTLSPFQLSLARNPSSSPSRQRHHQPWSSLRRLTRWMMFNTPRRHLACRRQLCSSRSSLHPKKSLGVAQFADLLSWVRSKPSCCSSSIAPRIVPCRL